MDRILAPLISIWLILLVSSCGNGRKPEKLPTVRDSLPADIGIKYNVDFSSDMDEIEKILSTSWVEILNVKGDWIVDTPSDGEVPRFDIQSDTITFDWGDGVHNYYKVDSVRKTRGKEVLWKLNVNQFFKDRKTDRDTLTITIRLVGFDKAYWTVGTQLDGMFLDYNYIDDFPRQEVDYNKKEQDSI